MSDALTEAREAVSLYCDTVPEQLREVKELVDLANGRTQISEETLNLLFNAMHRMSGAALCMGFPFMGHELGRLEDELDPQSDARGKSPQELLTFVSDRLELLDRLKTYVTPENSSLISSMAAEVEKQQTDARNRNAGLSTILKKQRVLYADDDVAIRMLMRHILSELGISKFEVFSNGQELLQAADQFKPTVVITDWRMEPVNGVELLQKIRGRQTKIASDCPVIFLSSRNSLGEVREAVGKGANHFLIKPFTIESVRRAICQVVSRTPPPRDDDEDVVLL